MQIKPKKIKESIEKLLKEKGKRKFLQSVEMVINFRAIDFSKPENRLNLDVVLPKGRGKKENEVIIIGSDKVVNDAKKLKLKAILVNDLQNYSPKEVKKLAESSFFLAEPKAMGLVAKNWGKILGPRGKIPRPLLGDLKKAVESVKNSVRLQTKGKYLPTLHTLIGEESMDAESLAENAEAVINEIKKKVPEGNIKSIYFKLTMSKPVKLGEWCYERL